MALAAVGSETEASAAATLQADTARVANVSACAITSSRVSSLFLTRAEPRVRVALDRLRVDHGQARHRHGEVSRRIGLPGLGFAPALATGGGGAKGLDDQDLLGIAAVGAVVARCFAHRIATVGDADCAGELELDESEEAQSDGLFAHVGGRGATGVLLALVRRKRVLRGTGRNGRVVDRADLIDQALPLLGLEQLRRTACRVTSAGPEVGR